MTLPRLRPHRSKHARHDWRQPWLEAQHYTQARTQSWSVGRSRWFIDLFSRRLCVFAGITPSSTVQVWAFVFDQADGNARVGSAKVAAAFTLLSESSPPYFGVRPLASVPIARGSPLLVLLTSADNRFGVAMWMEHNPLFPSVTCDYFFFFTHRNPCGMVRVAASTSSSVPWTCGTLARGSCPFQLYV